MKQPEDISEARGGLVKSRNNIPAIYQETIDRFVGQYATGEEKSFIAKIVRWFNEEHEADLQKRLTESERQRERLMEALEHYADEEWLHSFGGTKLAQQALSDARGEEAEKTR